MEFTDGIASESGMVTTFNYAEDNNEFTGQSDYYVLVGSGIPARSTLTAPPELKENQQAVWNGALWDVMPDYRGNVIYSGGESSIWSSLGDLPPGYNLQPSKSYHIAEAGRKKAQLKAIADSEIAWRQDAVDSDIATTEESSALAAWRKYRVLLMRVDTSKTPDIEWPTPTVEQAR